MSFTYLREFFLKCRSLGSLPASESKWFKYAFTKRNLGFVGITLSVSGTILWLQVIILRRHIKTVTDVHEVERGSSKFIYLPDTEKDTEYDTDDKKSLKKSLKALLKEKKVKLLPWLKSRLSDPWALLSLAKSDDASLRKYAVETIANKNWKDHKYRYVAQACDARTLVGLARSQNADDRLFLPMPSPPKLQHRLEDEFRILLYSLPKEDIGKCLQYFTSRALHEGNLEVERGGLWSFGGTGLEFTKSVSPVPEERIEIICLQALASHSADPHHCQEIVKLGGLQLLQQTYLKCQKSVIVARNIAKILGNLAVHPELHKDIIQAGWVTILHKWMKSPDLTLSLHTARALANLDRDFGSALFPDGIYLIHPLYRSKEPVYADVVFVHGLLGGPFKTWRQQDRKAADANKVSNGTESVKKGTYTFCWPKDWLPRDCPNIRVLSVEYDTDLSMWNANCPYESEKRTLHKRATDLLSKLKETGIGSRPIIWVGHSMGGLLIKKLLTLANTSDKLQSMAQNSVGVIFYSTPHHGSPLAAFSNKASFVISPTIEVQEMSRDSLMLRTLHSDFQQLAMSNKIPCLSFGETEKTSLGSVKLKLLVVPPESSDPGIGEFHSLPTNHLNICKPWDDDSQLYRQTIHFIKRCIFQGRIEHILKAGIAFTEMSK